MHEEYFDPLYRIITVNDTNYAGNHPFKHLVNPNELKKTIAQPDSIFGHATYSTRNCYVRCRDAEDGYDPSVDKNHMCQAVVEMDEPNIGHVVTSYYTDWIADTVNVKDIKYENNHKL